MASHSISICCSFEYIIEYLSKKRAQNCSWLTVLKPIIISKCLFYTISWKSFPCWWWDFNNRGKPSAENWRFYIFLVLFAFDFNFLPYIDCIIRNSRFIWTLMAILKRERAKNELQVENQHRRHQTRNIKICSNNDSLFCSSSCVFISFQEPSIDSHWMKYKWMSRQALLPFLFFYFHLDFRFSQYWRW